FGHRLRGLDLELCREFIRAIHAGDQSLKPGWVRLSLQPIMTDGEVEFMIHAVHSIVRHISVWRQDYRYNRSTNSWVHPADAAGNKAAVSGLFTL
ncbi:selenocysteine lyase, partial [Paenibacillus riograndensis]